MARPEFKPTAAMRRKVANAAGGGMAHEDIALALGISRNTLEKHFNDELSFGACARRMEVLNAMVGAALKGNVTAQKAYLAMNPVISAPDQGKQADDKPEAKAEPKGKKEKADADAITAQVGTEWNELLPKPAVH